MRKRESVQHCKTARHQLSEKLVFHCIHDRRSRSISQYQQNDTDHNSPIGIVKKIAHRRPGHAPRPFRPSARTATTLLCSGCSWQNARLWLVHVMPMPTFSNDVNGALVDPKSTSPPTTNTHLISQERARKGNAKGGGDLSDRAVSPPLARLAHLNTHPLSCLSRVSGTPHWLGMLRWLLNQQHLRWTWTYKYTSDLPQHLISTFFRDGLLLVYKRVFIRTIAALKWGGAFDSAKNHKRRPISASP